MAHHSLFRDHILLLLLCCLLFFPFLGNSVLWDFDDPIIGLRSALILATMLLFVVQVRGTTCDGAMICWLARRPTCTVMVKQTFAWIGIAFCTSLVQH